MKSILSLFVLMIAFGADAMTLRETFICEGTDETIVVTAGRTYSGLAVESAISSKIGEMQRLDCMLVQGGYGLSGTCFVNSDHSQIFAYEGALEAVDSGFLIAPSSPLTGHLCVRNPQLAEIVQ